MKQITIILTFLMTLSSPVVADDFMMSCDDSKELYKYSKPLVGKITIGKRKDAEWKPWCEDKLIITDGGAKCIYQIEHRPIIFTEKIMTTTGLEKKKNQIKNQYKRCREIFKDTLFPSSSLDMLVRIPEDEKEEIDCLAAGPAPGIGDFFELSLAQYVDKYTVAVGQKYTHSEYVNVKTEVIDILDFYTNQKSFRTAKTADSRHFKSWTYNCKKR